MSQTSALAAAAGTPARTLQVNAPQSSPATCWWPVVVTPVEAALVGPARPGFQTLFRIINVSEAALCVLAKAHRLADLQLSSQAPSRWSPYIS